MPAADQLEYPFKTRPRSYQLACWRANLRRKAFGYGMEMGTGKTWVAINTAAWLYDHGEVDSLVVFAPKGVYRNWQDEEIPKHMPEHVRYRVAAWSSSASREDRRQMDLLCQLDSMSYLRVLLVNVEAMATKRAFEFVEKFLLGCRPMMVVDESTTIKHAESKRTKALVWLGRYAKYRRIMSGEPAANSPFDLYSQFDFLDPHLLGFSSFYSFRNHFAKTVGKNEVREVERVAGWRGMTSDQLRARGLDPEVVNAVRRGAGRNYTAVLEYRNMDELQRIVAPHMYIVKKADVLTELPPKVYQTRDVEMNAEQEEAYDRMKHECMVEVEELLKKHAESPRKASQEGAPADKAPLASPAQPGSPNDRQLGNFETLQLALRLQESQEEKAQASPDGACHCWDGAGAGDRPASPVCPDCGLPLGGAGKLSSAAIVITQLLRLHQIACGFLKTDDGETVDLGKTNPRVEELVEVLRNHQGKAIVWANYQHSIEQVAKAVAAEFGPESVVTYYGPTKGDARRAAIKAFQDPGSPVRFFVSNRTGAFGITLTQADLVVYYSNDYDREVRGQSEDRAHRIGQLKSVLYVDLRCRGTVDEKIIRALRDKKKLSELITASNWKEWFE